MCTQVCRCEYLTSQTPLKELIKPRRARTGDPGALARSPPAMQSHSEKGLGTNVSSLGRKSPTSKPCSLEDSLETLSKATPDVYTRSQPHPQGYSNPRPWCDAGEQGAGRSQHGHCRGRQDRESDRSRDPSATLGSHLHLLEEEVSGVLPHPHPSPNSSCTWQSDRPGLTFLPSAAY